MLRAFLHFIGQRCPLIMTFGLILIAEAFVTVEWSLPYCNNPEDGPMYAVTGLPFPYSVPSLATSIEYLFIPYIYALNLLILSCGAYPLLCYCFKKLIPQYSKLRTVIGCIGLALISIWASAFMIGINTGIFTPTTSITNSAYGAYFELRPIALRLRMGTSSCTPSKYWFPQGWHGS